MKATKKDLVGRTIVAVDFQPFKNGRGGTAYNPVFTLDNGRHVYFKTQETDVGEYGTEVGITDKPETPPKRLAPAERMG